MTMPLAYRPAAFAPVPSWRRWWPLAQQEAGLLFQSRWGQAIVFLCLLPAVGRLVMLLILFGVLQFGPPGMRAIGPGRPRPLAAFDPLQVEFYVDPVLAAMPGMVVALLLSALVPARAIARDRSTNALELYWTRGISPYAYVLAKWVGSALLLGVVTVLAPLALWSTAALLHEDWGLLASTWWPMVQALAGLAAATLVWTALAILVSASCASANAAMVLWTMLLVGSAAVGAVAAAAARDPSLRTVFSLWECGALLARQVGGSAPRGAPVAGCLCTLGTVLFVLGLRAHRHLRVAEAVQ
jgi:ABC-type transport system involved in multi-copper enzyme maturation permease subunit